MNETTLTIEEASRCLADVVERVQSRGEAAILTKAGRPVARIVPVSATQNTVELIAFLRQWRIDHPEHDEQFAEAIEASRKAVRPPHDPWE